MMWAASPAPCSVDGCERRFRQHPPFARRIRRARHFQSLTSKGAHEDPATMDRSQKSTADVLLAAATAGLVVACGSEGRLAPSDASDSSSEAAATSPSISTDSGADWWSAPAPGRDSSLDGMSSTDTVDDGQSDSWDAAESSGNSDAIPSDATPSDASLDADAPIDGSPAPWVLTISPATLLVEADAPPFDGGFYPSSLGNSDVTGVTVGPTSFTGAVELSVTGLPSSSTAAFIGSPVQAAFWANLNVTVSSATPLGSYVLTVLGKSSGMSQTATVTLVVASAQT